MKSLPDRVRAEVARRRSGAARKHGDRRTKRNRDQFTRNRRAMAEAKEK